MKRQKGFYLINKIIFTFNDTGLDKHRDLIKQ